MGGTGWDGATTAEMAGEIQTFQSRVDTEGWDSAFKKTIAFIGNNIAEDTLDGDRIIDVAADNGCILNRGTTSWGYGYSLGALDDGLKGMGFVQLGQGSNSINTAAEAEIILDFMDKSTLSCVVMGHGVVPSAPGAIDILETEFDAVMGAFADELVVATPRIRVADFIRDAKAKLIL
jgi:hypothetical protein